MDLYHVFALLIYHAANFVKPHFADVSLYIYMQIAIYVSTVVAAVAFGMSLLAYCEIRMPKALRNSLGGAALFCIVSMLTIGHHRYWFADGITFTVNPQFPTLYVDSWQQGKLFYLINTILVLIALVFVVFLLVSILKKKGRKTKILRILIAAILLPASVTVLSLFHLVPTAMVNHATYIMLNIAMLLIVVQYDITTTVSDAKEQAVETVNDGIVIMDSRRHFQFANRKAVSVFPELGNDNPDVVTGFIKTTFTTDLIKKDERTYEIRQDTERDNFGHVRGNLILIHDITEQEQRIREQEKAYRAQKTLSQAIQAMAQAIDAKDLYTRGHSNRVAEYAKMIAERMGIQGFELQDIYRMGLLHDIGKIGTDDAIIRKDSGLTDEEYAMIKSHTVKGDEILLNITAMPTLHQGARWHHERFDGRGYPDHLAGEDIPLYGRIIAVADCYDAMSSNRSYRKALPQAVIRAEIEKGRGSQFDPHIAEIMLQIIDEDIQAA